MSNAALSDDEQQLLDKLADGIATRNLTSVAIFMLESMKPLSFVGSQAMLVLRPLVATVWGNPMQWDQIQKILEKRIAVETLLQKLESRA